MITKADANGFDFSTMALPWDGRQLAKTAADYRLMLVCVIDAILDRYDRDPDYPFLDTKLNLLEGTDFAADDPIRGKGMIYSWIQGRGLESLAGHYHWLKECAEINESLREALCGRIRRVTREVLTAMESIRRANGGKLFFMMTADGQPMRITPDGETEPCTPDAAGANYSDLFYVKGLAAAAHLLGDSAKLAEAERWFQVVISDIREGRFVSDQQGLDPRNLAIRPISSAFSHGPWMISVGGAARLLACTGKAVYSELGLVCLDHILTHHVNLAGDNEVSRQYDMWEFLGADGRPELEDGKVLRSDPGHATEFVGLALKFLDGCEGWDVMAESDADRIATYRRQLEGILIRNFENGFSPKGYGIVKAVDLVLRRVLNSDMPWWSLPETMRAAMEAWCGTTPDRRAAFAEIASKCSNAFLKYYVRRELDLMAVQTIDERGKPVAVIPATPDADPGYHTGLSVIDFLGCLEKAIGE